MGRIKEPHPAKLIVGIIASPGFVELAHTVIEKNLGKIDYESSVIPFDWTNYYLEEMGENLLRQWVSVEGLVRQDELPDIKLLTNELEKANASDGRKINLDPGLLLHSKLILATTKDYSHRIYLGKGIFAEVTLIYRRKSGFQPLQWTYPDYKSPYALEFFNRVREIYIEDMQRYLAQKANVDIDV